MKKNDVPKWSSVFQRMALAVMLTAGCAGMNAQVGGYTFSQTNGTFASIATTGSVVSGSEATTAATNDTAGWALPLPFNFKFNGLDYTSVYVNSNGGATFGTVTADGAALISATTAYDGAIAVMNRDLFGAFVSSGTITTGSNVITNVVSMQGIEVGKLLASGTGTGAGIPTNTTVTAFDEVAGTITMSNNATANLASVIVRYGTGRVYTATEGTAPNRVFVVEWKGYNDYGTTAALSNHLNFQLRLAEGSNTVTTVYGPTYNISTTSRTNQVGLRGASNVDFNNRSGAAGNPWVDTSAGTANNATVARDNTNYPASGLTFTWTPHTCFAPLNLNVTNVGLTTADLAWSASISTPANGYDVYYSAVNTAPTAGTVLNASNSASSNTLSVSLAGLSTGTTYYVWLRSKCSSLDVGPWGYSGVFTTLCSVFTAPYTQNFDNTNVGSSTNNVAPNCWSYVEPAGFAGYGYVIASNANSAPNSFYMYNSTGSSGNQMLVSPPTLNLSDGTRRVKFTAKSSSANYTVQVGTLSDPTDPTSYTAIGSAISLTTTHTEYIINIPAGTNQYLAFRHGLGANNRGIYIDNISVENVPTCLEPTALQSTAGSQTSTSGVVTWTVPATTSPTGYEIYYSTVNTAPTAATVLDAANSLSVIGTTATVSGLAPSTTYYIWVRSVCSATDKSIWTQNSVNFRTLCQPPTVTGITVSPNPVCINGMATLTANTVAGATINWYSDATSVTPLATGTNYTTAPLAATTNYYVSASTASSDQVGPVNPSALGGISASNYAIATYYQIFNVTVPTTLISVDVFPVSTVAIGTTSSIEIRDSAGTSLVTVPYTVSVNDGVTPQTVTLNFPLPVGTGYRIGQGTGINLNRNTSGAAYPFTSGAITVTGNNFDPDYWYYIYNWNFITSCESPRTMVTATVDSGCTMGTSETAGAKATVMYPNPFTDVLNISDVKNVKSISVLDISGRVVKSIDKPAAQIHLGDLKSGMYLISLQYKDGSVHTMKAIKK